MPLLSRDRIHWLASLLQRHCHPTHASLIPDVVQLLLEQLLLEHPRCARASRNLNHFLLHLLVDQIRQVCETGQHARPCTHLTQRKHLARRHAVLGHAHQCRHKAPSRQNDPMHCRRIESLMRHPNTQAWVQRPQHWTDSFPQLIARLHREITPHHHGENKTDRSRPAQDQVPRYMRAQNRDYLPRIGPPLGELQFR